MYFDFVCINTSVMSLANSLNLLSSIPAMTPSAGPIVSLGEGFDKVLLGEVDVLSLLFFLQSRDVRCVRKGEGRKRKKPCNCKAFRGEDEIRTRGTLIRFVGLANRWFQPLTHLS
jgi:hypothetical protein